MRGNQKVLGKCLAGSLGGFIGGFTWEQVSHKSHTSTHLPFSPTLPHGPHNIPKCYPSFISLSYLSLLYISLISLSSLSLLSLSLIHLSYLSLLSLSLISLSSLSLLSLSLISLSYTSLLYLSLISLSCLSLASQLFNITQEPLLRRLRSAHGRDTLGSAAAMATSPKRDPSTGLPLLV